MNPAEGSTVIGKSVIIRGDLSGHEDLYLDGDIEGTITLKDNRLTIGPNAQIKADITVRDLIVFGKLAGNIHAAGRVDLRQSASVKGDVFAGRLSIEESAMLSGRVELTGSSERPSSAAASSSAKAMPPEETATLSPQPTA